MKKIAFIILMISVCTMALNAVDSYPNLLLGKLPDHIDDKQKINELLELSELYTDSSDLKLRYQLRALQIAEKNNWRSEIGLCYYHLGWYYLYNSDKNNTLKNFKKAIENSDDPFIKINSHGILSNICSWAEYNEDALIHARKGLQIGEESNSAIHKAYAYMYLGDAYRYNEQILEANACYFNITNLLMYDTTPSAYLLKMVYLYTLNPGAADFPLYMTHYALKMMRNYEKASDREKQIYAFSLMKVATAYNKSAKNEIIKQVELENQQKQMKVYIGGITILVLMSVLLYRQNYSRKKTNKKLELANIELAEANSKLADSNKELEEANELKSRFFGILNHDLRRPVGGLISYLELKKKSTNIFNEEEQADFEQKTIDMTQHLLDNMEELLFWCKSQMQNFTPVFRDIQVSEIFDNNKSFFNTESKTNFIYKIDADFEIRTDVDYLKTIMRNLTSNAVKALESVENGYIEWKAYIKDNCKVLSVTNNGPAIPQEKIDILYNNSAKENIKDGLGLIIIRDLAKAIQCEIKVETDERGNTSFLILFP